MMIPAPDVGRINVAMMAVCVGRMAPGWLEHIRYAASITVSTRDQLLFPDSARKEGM